MRYQSGLGTYLEVTQLKTKSATEREKTYIKKRQINLAMSSFILDLQGVSLGRFLFS